MDVYAAAATRPLLLSEPQVLLEAGHPPSDTSSSYGRPVRQPQAPLEEEVEQEQGVEQQQRQQQQQQQGAGAEAVDGPGTAKWGLPYLDRLKSHPVLGSSYGSSASQL
jgi:hypothetical protein